MRAAVAILLACLIGTSAAAGPWARDKGKAFLLTAQETDGRDFDTVLYAEYGLGGGWTIGFDGLYPTKGFGTPSGIAFVRRSFTRGSHQFGVELGLGARLAGGQTVAILRPGASWGRGFDAAWPGWGSVALAAEISDGGVTYKADTTLGLRPHPRLKAILQVQASLSSGGLATLRAAPALVWEVRKGFDLEVSARAPLDGTGQPVFRAGTWVQF